MAGRGRERKKMMVGRRVWLWLVRNGDGERGEQKES